MCTFKHSLILNNTAYSLRHTWTLNPRERCFWPGFFGGLDILTKAPSLSQSLCLTAGFLQKPALLKSTYVLASGKIKHVLWVRALKAI
jgi:hypothetical protein